MAPLLAVDNDEGSEHSCSYEGEAYTCSSSIHPHIVSAFQNRNKDVGDDTLQIGGSCPLSKSSFDLLDHPNADYLVTELTTKPHSRLHFRCSITASASHLVSLYLSQSPHVDEVELTSVARKIPTHATDENPDSAILKCLTEAFVHGTTSIRKLTLRQFDFTQSSSSSLALMHLLQSASHSLCSLNLKDCILSHDGNNECSPWIVDGYSSLTKLQEFSMEMCSLSDSYASSLLHNLSKSATSLQKLSLYRCNLGPMCLGPLTDLLSTRNTRQYNHVENKDRECNLEELILTEDKGSGLFASPQSKELFLNTLQHENDSLIHIRLTTSSPAAFRFHRQVQACAKRNRLHAQVRSSLQSSLELALWSHGLSALAQKPQHGSSSAMYLALSCLSPQLGQN